MKLHRCLILFTLSIALPPVMLADTAVTKGETGDRVEQEMFISEIKPFRDGGDSSLWVELRNFGVNAVMLNGWRIQDGRGAAFVFDNSVGALAAGSTVVVLFVADDRGLPLIGRDGISALAASSEEAALFLQSSNECALFRRESDGVQTLVDYVCWEKPGSSDLLSSAVKRRLWLEDAYVSTQRTKQLVGGGPSLPPGGTIGRVRVSAKRRWSDWLLYPPTDATFGSANVLPRPQPTTPRNAEHFQSPASVRFTWRSTDPVSIQVSRDHEFEQLVLEEKEVVTLPLVPFKTPDALSAGEYFWRIKAHWQGYRDVTQQVTDWSEPRSFVIDVPPAPPETKKGNVIRIRPDEPPETVEPVTVP